MAGQNGDSWIDTLGCRVSQWVADVAAHPFAQTGVILFCAMWWMIGLPTDILTAGLSILAITLTQMVLNRQNEREAEDRRRDVAMHAKLDELISATRMARNELVGIEEREEEEIVQLKDEVKVAIEESTTAADPVARETAKKAIDQAAERVKRKIRKKAARTKPPPKRRASARR
jgi:low affinity Fe/Cu permease